MTNMGHPAINGAQNRRATSFFLRFWFFTGWQQRDDNRGVGFGVLAPFVLVGS